MGDWAKIVTRIGAVKAHVLPVAREIVSITPEQLYFIWGYPGRGTGEHAKGLALDFMTYELGGGVNNPGPQRDWIGHSIARYLVDNRDRLNVKVVIWNRRQISAKRVTIGRRVYEPWTWRPYTGSNPHVDHVHADFDAVGTYTPPEDDEVTPEDRKAIVAELAAELGPKLTAAVWGYKPPVPPMLDPDMPRVPIFTWITHGRVNTDEIEAIVRRFEAKFDQFMREIGKDAPELANALLSEAETADHATDERRHLQYGVAMHAATEFDPETAENTGPGLVLDGGEDDGHAALADAHPGEDR